MIHRRDVLKTGLAAGLGTGVVSVTAQDGQQAFSAGRLSGRQQPQPLETPAKGAALFAPNKDTIQYVLLLRSIQNVTQAHIHRGGTGENGPVVVWLYPGPQIQEPRTFPGRFDGVLAQGEIRADDLVGPLRGQSLDNLVREMQSGTAYVNVHTEAHPDGEIRGQIAAVQRSEVQFREQIDSTAENNSLGFQRSVRLSIQESS